MSAVAAHACSSLPPVLAFFEGIGAMEMLLVAVIGLLLFGGKGLPDMARTVGRMVREFKKATQGVEEEVRRVMHEEPAPAPRPKPRPRPLQVIEHAALPVSGSVTPAAPGDAMEPAAPAPAAQPVVPPAPTTPPPSTAPGAEPDAPKS